MNQLTFRCKKDGTEFELKQGITKGQHYDFENGNPDTYDQQVHEQLYTQGQEFTDKVFEHIKQCGGGEIASDPASHMIAC